MANKFEIDDPTTMKNFAERMLPPWTSITRETGKSEFRRAGGEKKSEFAVLVMEENHVLALACMLRVPEIAAMEKTSIIFSEKAVKISSGLT